MVRAKKMSREEVKIQRDLAKSSGWQIINHHQYFIYKSKDFTGKKHEVLPSGTFVELLSFRLPPYQSLHLCKIFSSLNASMKLIHINYL